MSGTTSNLYCMPKSTFYIMGINCFYWKISYYTSWRLKYQKGKVSKTQFYWLKLHHYIWISFILGNIWKKIQKNPNKYCAPIYLIINYKYKRLSLLEEILKKKSSHAFAYSTCELLIKILNVFMYVGTSHFCIQNAEIWRQVEAKKKQCW